MNSLRLVIQDEACKKVKFNRGYTREENSFNPYDVEGEI